MNQDPSASAPLEAVIESTLGHLWAAANDLGRLRPAREGEYRVSIFGSARVTAADPVYAEVRELARRLAALGCTIVTGGGPGLMQVANEGERLGDPENLRQTIGIRVELPFEQGSNPFVEQDHTHRTFFTRLHHFARLSDAFVVVEGGIGTTLESLMIWQLLQVKHLPEVPLIFVGPMWRGLVDWAKAAMLRPERPLASARDLELPVCVATASDAVAVIERDRSRRRPA